MLPQSTYPFPPREHILWQFLDTSLSAISLFQDSVPRAKTQWKLGTRYSKTVSTVYTVIRSRLHTLQRGRNKNSVEKFTPVHPVFSIIGGKDRQQYYTQ